MEQDYLEVVFGSEKEKDKELKTSSKQKNALNCALDIRKFEISLYWKRATYFWAFIAAIFAGFFILITNCEPKDDCLSHSDFVILIIILLGYIFSFSWYLVNRGSKYWQKNWEMHVDFLEDEIMGSLYKTVKNPDHYKWYKITSGYPCSVSKINQLLSLIVSLVWLILTVIYSKQIIFKDNWFHAIAASLIIILLISSIIFKFTKTDHKNTERKKGFLIRKPNKDN